MNIESFLPSYPDINEIYDLYNGEHFNEIIFRKKEFYDLKLDVVQPSVGKSKRKVLNHQEIVSRFLASYTLYDELLLFHQAGTGKTFTAIHAVENIIKDSNEYMINKAIILVPNKTIMAGFERELLHVADGKYLYNIDDIRLQIGEESEELRKIQVRRSKKLYKKFYSIYTHESFFNELEKLSDVAIKKQYSNAVIIIDEVHQISEHKYKTYYNFLHIIENRKILLLSGTPMINDASEIAQVMNLILPKQLELPYGTEFNNRYKDSLHELIPIFKGRVSYLKSKVDIDYKFNGTNVEGVYLPLFMNTMSRYQYSVYASTIADVDVDNIDNVKRNTLYNQEIHASLFVYPDGSYGETGFNNYINYSKTRKWFKDEFLSKNRQKPIHEKLELVRRYSVKYATIIQMLLNNPTHNVFIYLEHIRGSGAIVLCLCLELFGFVHTSGEKTKLGPHQRYSLLSEISTGDNKKTYLDINNIQQIFNRNSNRNGKYLRVLIGGKMIQQGITFYSIRQIHIVSPAWNFSNIDQAIARGIRLGAHRFLPANTPVDIYLHSIDTSRVFNIDYYMYKTAQEKDYVIKNVEYTMKLSSMDCALSYDRNVDEDGKDNSRECEYNDCIYRCNGVEFPYVRDENKLLLDTYNIYYSTLYVEDLIKMLQHIFKTRFSVSIGEILTLVDKKYTFYQIFQGFNVIIKKSILFKNKYGFLSYLHEHDNIFFLTNNINDGELLSSYYCQYPPINAQDTFLNAIDSTINDIINDITDMPLNQQKIQIKKLPLPTQEQFIENAFSSNENTPLSTYVVQEYKEYIETKNNNIYSYFLVEKHISNNPRIMDMNTKQWSDFKQDIIDVPTGIFGIMDRGKLKIIDNRDGTGKNKGKVCKSYSKEDLIDIMKALDIPIPVNENKRTYCNSIKNSNKLKML